MMRALFATVALVSAMPLTQPALAQTSGGGQATQKPAPGVMTPDMRRRNTHEKFEGEFDTRRLMDPTNAREIHGAAGKIAECIVRRSGDKAATFLGGGLTQDAAFERIGEALTGRYKNCAASDATAPAIAISGALAEQLLVAQAPSFEDRASLVSEDRAHKFFGDLTGAVTFDMIAGCLAVYSPGLAYKLVRTEPGSDEEAAALTALFGQTPECRMPAPPSSIPPLYQRAALATALFQWSNTAS